MFFYSYYNRKSFSSHSRSSSSEFFLFQKKPTAYSPDRQSSRLVLIFFSPFCKLVSFRIIIILLCVALVRITHPPISSKLFLTYIFIYIETGTSQSHCIYVCVYIY